MKDTSGFPTQAHRNWQAMYLPNLVIAVRGLVVSAILILDIWVRELGGLLHSLSSLVASSWPHIRQSKAFRRQDFDKLQVACMISVFW